MMNEVHCACQFISRMLQARSLPYQFIKPFTARLEELMIEQFKDHWDTSNPQRGSAYRCIRINGRMDPVIREAAKVTGLTSIRQYLPPEFTMWVDPHDVSYRFGEDGSICSCPLTINDDGSVIETVSTQWESRANTNAHSKSAPSSVPVSTTNYLTHNLNMSSRMDRFGHYQIPVKV